MSTKSITGTGLLLAVALLAQSLRLIFPFIPNQVSMFLIGSDFHEDVINIIMKDLVKLLEPKYIEVWGKFLPRGGLSIDPYCNYGKPGTDWEQVAWNRMSNHDMFPEKIDNR